MYADVLVIVNLYVEYILLRLVQKVLGVSCRGRRLVLGALTGGVLSLGVLLPGPGWVALLWGGGSALATAAGAFAPAKPLLLLRETLCLWCFSLLLAGFFLLIAPLAPPGMFAVLGGTVYIDVSLPVLFGLTLLAYGTLSLSIRLLPREHLALHNARLRIEHQGQCVTLDAKADTGSSLREPFSGLPVILCQRDALGALCPAGLEDALAPGAAPAPGVRLVPFSSVGGKGVLPAFRPDRVCLEPTGQQLACFLAVSTRPLSAGQFQAVYNPDQFT